MPEPLSVIALLLFGFIAGWVVHAATGGRGGSGGPAPDPAPAPVAEPEAPSPEPEAEPEPAPAALPDAVDPAPEPAPAAAEAPRSADAERRVAAAVAAYDDVVDEWLDDRGQMGPAGQSSIERFDAALQSLQDAEGVEDVRAALHVAADLIHERRAQPLDAATDAALRNLEPRFRPAG